MHTADTIVAPATPPGEGGVSIVRLSGPDSERLLGQVFSGRAPDRMQSHHLYHGKLQQPDGTLVDEVLVVVMRGPGSFTGEDVVEVHCHGGSQILRSALDLFLSLGARLACPGEFTQRAFLNGRIDLAQAEAVASLISARSADACRAALGQLGGRLSRLLQRFAEQLKTALVLVEAHIDFPDDEVGSLGLTPLCVELSQLRAEMTRLLDSFDTGRVLREGVNLLILGRPNVGKSSLMNAMLGEARAIVTEIPGTTRDTLEEQMVFGGFPVRLIDTAGVCETDNPVEREGVERARQKIGLADLVLLVVDGSQPLRQEDLLAASLCDPAKTLPVLNKSDMPKVVELASLGAFREPVVVSAKREQGLDQLQSAVVSLLGCSVAGDQQDEVLLSERRHREALLRARQCLERFLLAAKDEPPLECLAIELRESLGFLGLITGETTPDEILDQIFSRFCIGK